VIVHLVDVGLLAVGGSSKITEIESNIPSCCPDRQYETIDESTPPERTPYLHIADHWVLTLLWSSSVTGAGLRGVVDKGGTSARSNSVCVVTCLAHH